jgi:glycosyltransferase involved in cell wall biosynthesis/SAM-dependent methyltransferase
MAKSDTESDGDPAAGVNAVPTANGIDRTISAGDNPCIVCGSASVAHTVERGDGRHVVFCGSCGMGRLLESPAATDLFYDDDYYGRGGAGGPGYADYAFTAEHTLLWATIIVERFLPRPHGRILDIGCADGFLLRELPDDSARFGIEVNQDAARQAKSAGIDIIGSDILDPDLPERYAGAFDVITAIATFEHVLDIKQAFHNSLAMLADRGALIFEVPLISDVRDNTDWYTSSYEHISYPTVRSLERIFSSFPSYQFTGFEAAIAGFGSTYIGLASKDAEIMKECRRLVSVMNQADTSGLSDGDTRLHVAYSVVHAFLPNPDRILKLPLLLAQHSSLALITRITQLWYGDAVRAAQADWHEQQATNWQGSYQKLLATCASTAVSEPFDDQASRAGATSDSALTDEMSAPGPQDAVRHAALSPPASRATKARIVTLLPFMVKGNLALSIMRALRDRNEDVAVAFCSNESGGYTADRMEDFAAEGRLIDLTSMYPADIQNYLHHEFAARGTRLLVQVGAYSLYPILPYLKERNPSLKLIDTLYNEVGHTLNHFLLENCFDGVIVEGEYMRRFVQQRSLKTDPNVRIVENGVDLEHFRPGSRVAGTGMLHVGYIGRLSPEKNPIGFIELAEELGLQVPGTRFSLYGDGPLTNDVQQRVATSPLGEHLVYRGLASDVRDALHGIDVLVVPSKLDGRPNIIMEASACGVPVIAARVGGIPDLIEDGRNGILASPNEISRMVALLREWSKDPAVLGDLRLTCRAVAETHFDRDGMVDNYLATFNDFIGQ